VGKYDIFRARQSAIGSSQRDAHKQATIAAINAKFLDSLGLATVTLDGVPTDAILIFDKTQDDRFILFRPLTMVVRGGIIGVGPDNWLIVDVEQNELYPKATVLRCNQLIRWETYESDAVITAKASVYGQQRDQFMILPKGEYSVLLPYNNMTKLISYDARFVINSGAYSVIGFDNITNTLDGSGVLTVHIKCDVLSDDDDALTGLADNTKPTPTGGNLW
jgi:hypothetical protein